jgi:hypothetical protein
MSDEHGHEPAVGGGQKRSGVRGASDWVLANRSHWLRALLMLAFYFVLGLVKLLVGLMALFQFGSLLITGAANPRLSRFGAGLAVYTCDIVDYLTCAGERLPFPFSEWPGSGSPE